MRIACTSKNAKVPKFYWRIWSGIANLVLVVSTRLRIASPNLDPGSTCTDDDKVGSIRTPTTSMDDESDPIECVF